MAAITHQTSIDPTRSGKYPVILSEDLRRDGDAPRRKRQRISVQYNHKPISLDAQSTTIRPSGDAYTLSIESEDGKGSYKYNGSQRPSTSLALIYDVEKQSFVLDHIDAHFCFNLQSTPSNPDSASLAAEFPHLAARDPGEDGDRLFSDEEEDEDPDSLAPDPDNPYDYRHFLHRGASPSPQPSLASSPVPNHVFSKTSPLLNPSYPFHQPRSRTEAKKTKPTPQRRQQRYLSPKPQEEAKGDHEESDPNELVIDMGDAEPSNSRPWRNALGRLNDGASRSSRPISLRSAASSMSPSIRGESDEDKDKDVEEIDLGGPSVETPNQNAEIVESTANGSGWDDEAEDMFEAEMEQAMGEQTSQVVPAPPPPPAESSSESEEE